MTEVLHLEVSSLENNGEILERITLCLTLGNFSCQGSIPLSQIIRIQDYANDENLILTFYQEDSLVATLPVPIEFFRENKDGSNQIAAQSGTENDNFVISFSHHVSLEENLGRTYTLQNNPFEGSLLDNQNNRGELKTLEYPQKITDDSLTPEMRATLYLNLLETKLSKTGGLNQILANEFNELVLNIKNSIEELNQSDQIDNQAEAALQRVDVKEVDYPHGNYQDEQEKKVSDIPDIAKSLKLDGLRTKDISGRIEESARASERDVNIEKDKTYVMTIKKELSSATLHFIEDDFTRSVIQKMALGKKKVGVCRIKGSVQISEKEEVLIDKKNYFKEDCQRHYTHFFKSGTKYLYLTNLVKVLDGTDENATKLELKIDYTISPDHKSVVTPNGMIYISGAIPNAKTTLHLYSFSTNSLIEKQGMQVSDRKEYGFCYMSKNLFAVGGTHKGNVTARCERYDMAANKWIYLAPMNKPLKNVNICGFNNVYIYRFFGIDSGGNVDPSIERYDAARNKWTYLNFKIHPNLFGIYDTKSVQINKDCVFIFGGQNLNGFSPKYCKGYVLRVDDKREKNEAELLETKNFIPGLAGTFSQNSIISHAGEVLFLRESNLKIFY